MKKNLNSNEMNNNNDIIVKLFDNYMCGLIGGPKTLKARYLANFYKGCTFFYVIILMHIYKNFSMSAYIYLALHGSYGFLWIIKDIYFPDKNFDKKMTIPSMIGGFGILSIYWFLDFLEIAGYGIQNPSISRIIFAFLSYIFGVVIMLLSDCQKFFTLKYKKGLICEGMFYCNRNPNYFGEILVYGSFGIMIGNWISWGILVFIWLTVFNLNIYLKDVTSLQKKEGWDIYKRRSGRILFKFFENDLIHFSFYLLVISISINIYYYL